MLAWWQPGLTQPGENHIEQAEAFGMPPELLEELRQNISNDDVLVVELNWQAFNLFCDLESKFQVEFDEKGMPIFMGFSWEAAATHISMLGLFQGAEAERIRVWKQLLFCEQVLRSPESF